MLSRQVSTNVLRYSRCICYYVFCALFYRSYIIRILWQVYSLLYNCKYISNNCNIYLSIHYLVLYLIQNCFERKVHSTAFWHFALRYFYDNFRQAPKLEVFLELFPSLWSRFYRYIFLLRLYVFISFNLQVVFKLGWTLFIWCNVGSALWSCAVRSQLWTFCLGHWE